MLQSHIIWLYQILTALLNSRPIQYTSSGGSRILCLGGKWVGYFCLGGLLRIKRRRRETAIAEGKKPLTTRGLGERSKLPSGVWGGAPDTKAILNISSENGVHFWILLISHF